MFSSTNLSTKWSINLFQISRGVYACILALLITKGDYDDRLLIFLEPMCINYKIPVDSNITICCIHFGKSFCHEELDIMSKDGLDPQKELDIMK